MHHGNDLSEVSFCKEVRTGMNLEVVSKSGNDENIWWSSVALALVRVAKKRR
jgi:hypothetical protein